MKIFIGLMEIFGYFLAWWIVGAISLILCQVIVKTFLKEEHEAITYTELFKFSLLGPVSGLLVICFLCYLFIIRPTYRVIKKKTNFKINIEKMKEFFNKDFI